MMKSERNRYVGSAGVDERRHLVGAAIANAWTLIVFASWSVAAHAQMANWTLGSGSSATYVAGSVGIGTTTPSSTAAAHVVNSSGTGDPTILLENLGNAAGNVHLLTHRTGVGNAGIFRFKYFDSGANLVEAATVAGTIIDINSGTRAGGLVFSTQTAASVTASEKMRIDATGNVGIGISNPAYKLHVVGSIYATDEILGAKVIGAVYQDVAEWVPASAEMDPGTVVVLNRTKSNEVMPSSQAYDSAVAGVVSAQPGILLGVKGDEKEQIATTGRVRVRVDATREPISVGDLLVTSDKPGTAMKSVPVEIAGISMHRPGTIIGKALEPFSGGVGEILVLLSLQ